ncbi:MAG: TonB-dependent receptor [Hyphomonas sp.]
MNLSRFLCSASAMVILTAGVAYAQEDTAPERESAVDRVLGTVTVTATKKKDVENVQDVPVAVTAFNSDTLDALNVRDLESLSYSSPNVSLSDIGTAKGTANFSIRGLGINSSIPSIDPTVGVFVDGVYLGLNNGVVLDLFDLDSVEILRGPQGILFGRNTTGGAVLINTGNPTDEFEWKVRTSVETPIDSGRGGPSTTVQGTVSGPIFSEKLTGKLGGYYNTDDGYFENKFDGSDLGESQTSIIRAALKYEPNSDVTILAKAEKFKTRADGPNGQNRGVYDRDSFDIAIDNPGVLDNETTFASLRTDIDVAFGDGRITNILGYREIDSVTDADIDALPLHLFHSDTELSQEQISNELRYAGSFGKADVTVGAFWFQQEVAYTERRTLPTVTAAEFNGGGAQDHTVYGLFGQVDYEFTPKLTGIFGMRYGYEEKDVDITYVRPRPHCSVVDGTCPTSGTNPFVPGEPNGFTDKDDWSNFSPKIGFQYQWNDATQVYGHYTNGVRSGGYNFRIINALAFEALFPPTGSRAFDEESVDSYEIGMKHDTADGRGQLNAAVFFNQVSDMQRELNLSSPSSGVAQTIINTADADIMGFEAEGRYAVLENLLVTANIGVIDAEYTDVLFDISSDGVVNGADLALDVPRVPETTWGIGFIHDLDMGRDGSLVTRVNFQHRDKFAFTDNNWGWINPADQLDANLTWNTPVEGLSVSVYGKNLLDEVVAGGDTQVPFGGTLAPFAPGGVNLSNGVNAPYDPHPAAGTFSPLQPGRLLGFELTLRH